MRLNPAPRCFYIYNLQSRQVKRTPTEFYYWIDYLRDESVSRFHNYCQIQISIPACMMSSEYFTRTSVYLVTLKISEWIKLLWRHSHQIQGNWAGKNFITASRVNSQLITHARMQRWIWNLQLPTGSSFEYSWIFRKRSPKMQRLSDYLWEVVAYKNWTTGGLFREEAWACVLYGR